jgi:lysophospholipase L1-like esterase
MFHCSVRLIAPILFVCTTLIVHGSTGAATFEHAPAVIHQPRGGLGNVLQKLTDGKQVRIGYFGGSITAAPGWRPKTLQWLRQQFPKARVDEINGAIGGTGSDLGVFRYQQDVLQHKPDLVFIEFSVNDGGGAPEQLYRSMEGIVRQTWRADPSIDLCFVYTFRVGYEKDLDRGLCPRAPSAHEHVAQHYGIPSINMALHVTQLARDGKLVYKAPKGDASPELAEKIIFSHDGVHPLDAGHELYLDVIGDAIAAQRKDAKPGPHSLPTPLREDNWESARLVSIDKSMLHGSWTKLDRTQGLGKRFGNRMPVIWEGTQPGDRLQFKFKGTMIGLYDLLGPDGGQLVWNIDGKAAGPRPRFDHYCTYHRLASLRLAEGLEDKEHTVTVEIHPEQPDRSSVLDRVRNTPHFDPKKYEGTKARIGALMMLGKPLP